MRYRFVFLIAALLCMPQLRAGAQSLAQQPSANGASLQTNLSDLGPVPDASAATASELPIPPASLTPNQPTPPYAPSATGQAPGIALPLNLVPSAPTAAELKFLQATNNWNAWVASQDPACDVGLDSIADLTPNSDKVAIVMHGLGSSPQSMVSVIRLLKSQGFTVLAPRLNGHFEHNLQALDNVSYQKWVVQSEQVFELAKGFGSRITVVGHSLGGLLASRLAIKFPDQVERAILFAPAWRVRGMVSVASTIGSFLNISLNDSYNIPISCKLGQGYVPASAGKQIQSLIDRTENEFGGDPDADDGNPEASIFARMRVPRLVITAPDDDAVDSEMLTAACPALKTGCLELSVPNAKHTGITHDLNSVSTGKFAHSSIKSILKRFLSLDGRPRLAKQIKQ